MSDLFKKHKPRLSEDEERALWERVRTIPREASGGPRLAGADEPGRPWWAGLLARPAVRFGAPALAVALVAVVWVTQKEPVAPAREETRSRLATPPAATVPVPSEAEAPTRGTRTARVLAEKDDVARDEASRELAADVPADAYAPPPPAATPAPERREAKESNEVTTQKAAPPASVGAAGATGATNDALARKQRAGATAPASPQAVEGFYREDPRVGTIQAVGGEAGADRIAEVRAARGSRTSAALIGDRILVEVITPSGSGAFLETVSLPISGGVARIAVGNTPGSLWVEDGQVRDLVRIAGYEGVTDAPTRRRVDLATGSRGAGAAAIVAPDGRALSSRFVPADGGDARALGGPRSTTRSRAAALAAELILAVADGNASAVARVNEAAHRLVSERPSDESARALVAWSDDARAAFADR